MPIVLKSDSLYLLVTSGSVHVCNRDYLIFNPVSDHGSDLKIRNYVNHLCYLGLFQSSLHLHGIHTSLFQYNPFT